MLAIISISKQGNTLATLLSEKIKDSDCYTLPKWEKEGFRPIEGRMRHFCKYLFQEYDGLIFIMATGIVVRSIAPWLNDKTTDPAVVVVDDKGENAISLLSGHIGGANELTKKVADILNARPVISTASDINDLPAVDTLAQGKGLIIDSMTDAKLITSMIINKQKVELDDEYGIFDDDVLPEIDDETSGKIIVTNKYDVEEQVPYVRLVPENIILGIGCKKDTSPEKLMSFIKENIYELNLDLQSIKTISSINIKSGEKAIIYAVENLQCKSHFFTANELEEVEHLFDGSEFVKSTVGTTCVSATSAYLAGNKKGQFLVKKAKKDGMTLSVFETSM